MGVDSKGVCQTDSKDVFEICSKIESAINKMIKNQREGLMDKDNSSVHVDLCPGLEMVRVIFTYKGENRIIHVHFGCDSDAKEVIGKKIIWSVGMWGSSEEIVRTVGESLSDLGPIFLDLNDCDEIGLLPIQQVISSSKAHLNHCNQGEYEGGCKYGQDTTCPTLNKPAKRKVNSKKQNLNSFSK